MSEFAAELGKLSPGFDGGRFFFIWSWKLNRSFGETDEEIDAGLLFAFSMLFLFDPLNCDAAFTDERCNGDLFDSNEANALFPLL